MWDPKNDEQDAKKAALLDITTARNKLTGDMQTKITRKDGEEGRNGVTSVRILKHRNKYGLWVHRNHELMAEMEEIVPTKGEAIWEAANMLVFFFEVY